MLRSLTPLHIVLAVALGWPSVALADDFRALLVGNSYTYYNAPDDLPSSFEALADQGVPGWAPMVVDMVTSGGYTLAKHLADADGTRGDTALRQKLVLAPESFDVVVLQEQSQIPGFYQSGAPQWASSLAAAGGLADLASAAGAIPIYLMTWGRRDGDPNNPSIFPDFSAMQERLRAGYELYATTWGRSDRPVYVAPAGLAFQRVHDDLAAAGDPLAPGSLFTKLYSGDGSHPSNHGTFLTACVLYATLSGRDPRLLTWSPPSVTEPDRTSLQAAAASVVLDDPFEERGLLSGSSLPRYPWVKRWSDLVADETTSDILLSSNLARPATQITGAASHAGGLQVGTALGDGWLDLAADADLAVGSFTAGAGALVTFAAGGRITATGEAQLDGTLAVTGALPDTGWTVLIEAHQVTIGEVSTELPGGTDVAVVTQGDAQTLVWFGTATGPPTPAIPDPGPEAGDPPIEASEVGPATPDSGPPTPESGPSGDLTVEADRDAVAPDGAPAESDSGCAASSGAHPGSRDLLWWLALLLARPLRRASHRGARRPVQGAL